MKTKISVFIASGLGVGFIPLAPGTFGSILALPICHYALQISQNNWFYYPLIIIAIYILGYLSIEPARIFLGTRKILTGRKWSMTKKRLL
ncbi:phosphatidylglycerophosphatase A [Patescibacteria group bacterium]|nr:phosphatidylglycerophosphatase A [Patescibacteria group bacterium]